ncbi:hypothetical protein NUSPORA_01177 [Nucleospora cyclopteri]
MPTAKFEIECKFPEKVIKAISFGDKDNVKYEQDKDKIILHFTAKNVRNLVKATYSVCNKIQLSLDTIDEFYTKPTE